MKNSASSGSISTSFNLEISQRLASATPAASLSKVTAELAHSMLADNHSQAAVKISVSIGEPEQSAAKRSRGSSWAPQQKTQRSTENVVSQLKLQQRLTEAGVPVEGLTICDEGVDPETEMLRVEFNPIPNRVIPRYDTVEGCLNTMTAAFQCLSKIHSANAYHGSPEAENFIFQSTDRTSGRPRALNAYATNFQSGGELTNEQSKAPEDVKIALRDFGGRLLMAAEQKGYNRINILKVHLEPQVNFADQDEPDELVTASVMYGHLRGLKQLLSMADRDYPTFPNREWGPLDDKKIIQDMTPTRAATGRPPIK